MTFVHSDTYIELFNSGVPNRIAGELANSKQSEPEATARAQQYLIVRYLRAINDKLDRLLANKPGTE
jgi:hypothetical protein